MTRSIINVLLHLRVKPYSLLIGQWHSLVSCVAWKSLFFSCGLSSEEVTWSNLSHAHIKASSHMNNKHKTCDSIRSIFWLKAWRLWLLSSKRCLHLFQDERGIRAILFVNQLESRIYYQTTSWCNVARRSPNPDRFLVLRCITLSLHREKKNLLFFFVSTLLFLFIQWPVCIV